MVLLIDDDTAVQASLNLLLKQEGYSVKVARTPAEGLLFLEQIPVDLVMLDMNFTNDTSGKEGLNTLHKIHSKWPQVPVILITGWATVPLAVEGMKTGASDFIGKPWDNEQLIQSVKTILELKADSYNTDPSRSQLDSVFNFNFIVGQDSAFLKVLFMATVHAGNNLL